MQAFSRSALPGFSGLPCGLAHLLSLPITPALGTKVERITQKVKWGGDMGWDTRVLRVKTAPSLPPSHSLHPCCILQSTTSALPQIPGLHGSLAAVTSCAFPGLLNFAAQIFASPQAPSFPESQIPRHPLLLVFFRLFGLRADASRLVCSDVRKSLCWSRASSFPYMFPGTPSYRIHLQPSSPAPGSSGSIFPAYSVLAVPRPMSSLLDCPQFCLLPHSSG